MTNIRRSRGYSWESTIVKRFNKLGYWQARRLGGSSTGLPDVVAVNNVDSSLLAIEAKSGYSKYLYIPADQVQRCIAITDMFAVYKSRGVIFSFKFGRGFKKEYHFILAPAHYGLFDKTDKIHVRCNEVGDCLIQKVLIGGDNDGQLVWWRPDKFEMPPP